MRKLKLFNGRDWDCRGHLYVAAYSVKDAVELINAAYRKVNHLENRLDVNPTSLNEVNTYYSKGCWGNPMDGVVPERGVWRSKNVRGGLEGKPERVL